MPTQRAMFGKRNRKRACTATPHLTVLSKNIFGISLDIRPRLSYIPIVERGRGQGSTQIVLDIPAVVKCW